MGTGSDPGRLRIRPAFIFLSAALVGLASWGSGPTLPGDRAAVLASDAPRPGDDATFRPTVMVRNGTSLGSGTIIASFEGETLVLTASHVIHQQDAPVLVEMFRYNFGLERTRDLSGFPRMIPASLAARDPGADLAILRIRGQLAFPYVARLAPGVDPPPRGTAVTTIGFDKGEQLVGFSTRIRSVDRVDLEKGGGFRPFLVTEAPPEIGRSGGGLFRPDGALVGVCVGRAEVAKDRAYGLFTTLGNVRNLIRGDKELATAVARSNARPRGPER